MAVHQGKHRGYPIHGHSIPGPELSAKQRLAGLGVTVDEMKKYPGLLKKAAVKNIPLKALEDMLRKIREGEARKKK